MLLVAWAWGMFRSILGWEMCTRLTFWPGLPPCFSPRLYHPGLSSWKRSYEYGCCLRGCDPISKMWKDIYIYIYLKCGATGCSQGCSLITVISHWLYSRKAQVIKDGGRKKKNGSFSLLYELYKELYSSVPLKLDCRCIKYTSFPMTVPGLCTSSNPILWKPTKRNRCHYQPR